MTPVYDALLKERVELARLQRQIEYVQFLEDMDNNTRPSLFPDPLIRGIRQDFGSGYTQATPQGGW